MKKINFTKERKEMHEKKLFTVRMILSAVILFFFQTAVVRAAEEEKNLLMNPDMSIIKDGVPEGWILRGQARVEYDRTEKITVVYTELTNDFILQKGSLAPGHYLLRALAKTNTCGVALKAIGSMPIEVYDDYRWTELPFCIEGAGESNLSAMVGIHVPSIGGGKQGDLFTETRIKKLELVRLGDTSLPRRWATKIQAHPMHGIEAINGGPQWERPGRVIFHDTFTGTELWLMTQAGQTDLSYVGFPDFSNDGKYVLVGYRRPGNVMRTDGSFRYNPPSQTGVRAWTNKLLWLFPWEKKRLPEGADPSDWIAISRSVDYLMPSRWRPNIKVQNLATGETANISLPERPGWQIISVPSIHLSGRGPKISSIDHETMVWYSDDRKHLATSNMEGENFRIFPLRSISRKPENDSPLLIRQSYLVMIYDTWYNAIDKNGTRYFFYDFNHGKSINDPYNPYQLWALSLNENDERGPLRVMSNPDLNIPGDARGSWEQFSRSKNTQEGYLLLEDGTVVHGSSIGMHSGFSGTIRAKAGIDNKNRFIGSYPLMDRVSWPHEFMHDRDYAIVEAFTEPQCPVLMADLENDTFWTLAITNFHDYAIRYAQRPMYSGRPGFGEYHKPMIRTAPTQSPDFTKVVYCSSMLTGEDPERLFGDAYIAVARYPQPPVNVRIEGNRLTWDKPMYSAEIMGFNVYYSEESGKGSCVKLNSVPVKETEYPLPGNKNGFYTVTSVEYSGLESRMFSKEVPVGRNTFFRLFCQPEEGRVTKPMVPFFEPKGASNLYAVAVTDPELVYKKRLEEGLKGSVKIDVDIPLSGSWRIMARVRGMSGLERSSYTTGWEPTGEAGRGSFSVKVQGKVAGKIPVEGFGWKWVEIDTKKLNLSAGKTGLEFSTGDTGIAIDNILVTNDPVFIPVNCDNTPTAKPSVTEGLKIAEIKSEGEPLAWRGYTVKPPYVKLTWEASTVPQGVRYYNIYRSRKKEFEASPANLIGSNHETWFVDTGLEKGVEYYYRIEAVDNWDNRSHPCEMATLNP
ncbi:MAG TPA: fibronectin type III domain-containing protein [bacterium]|nr:fibronectin type III domain-containing protein [bacterium]